MTFYVALAEEPYDGDKVDGDKVEVPQEVHVHTVACYFMVTMYVCTYLYMHNI